MWASSIPDPDLINASLYNADMQVYKELMPEPKPARTCVGVAQLPAGGTDVEIEFVAYDG
jgi:2-iminobutanoate/2-iminopropanoate deaminase